MSLRGRHSRPSDYSLKHAAGSAALASLLAVGSLTIGPALGGSETAPKRRSVASPTVVPVPSSAPATAHVKASHTPASSLRSTLALARAQVGISGVPNKFTRWYADKYGAVYATEPWCAIFLVWLARRSGATVPHQAYTPGMADSFAAHGRWGSKPRVGAFVFFDWGGSRVRANIDHVGIVTAVHADGSVSTVEGNKGGAVRVARRSGFVVGYGYPAY